MRREKKWIDELQRKLRNSSSGRKRPPPKRGGSEAVTVEPDRPKLGEGGAAAPLEFDE